MKIMDYKLLIIVKLLFLTTFLNAQEVGYSKFNDIETFKKKSKETAELTNTIESSFTQEKFLSFLSEKVTSYGKFYFKNPNKLRWEYTKPFDYAIIINNEKMIIKNEKKENKFDLKSNKMFKEINEILVGCVNGSLLFDNEKFKTVLFENKEFVLAQLTPQSKTINDFIKTINIYIDKKDMTVSKIKMIEPTEDYTIISFKDKKINKGIKDEIFNIR